jgi:hypothetical protein
MTVALFPSESLQYTCRSEHSQQPSRPNQSRRFSRAQFPEKIAIFPGAGVVARPLHYPSALVERVAASGSVPAKALSSSMLECNEGEEAMLWTLFVILLVLWLLGLVSSYTLGGFIHILLVVALVVLIINLVSGRRTIV